jgi:cyclopropane fatty-acyl-phospholipid synthase-like methyltransferase
MASGENTEGKPPSNASLYSALSSLQYNTGCSFLETLDLNLGDKVLDMGCGTGELTKYIAGKVGDLGEVVGIDPDNERVKFAQDNMKMVLNASFHVGDSESGFLNDYQAYYDVHISNQVYHWLNNEDKARFVKVAFQCLKPGGLIAIQCVAEPDDEIDNCLFGSALGRFNVHYAKESSARKLLIEAGFTDVHAKTIPSVICCSSFDVLVKFFLAGCKTDIRNVQDKELLEQFKMKVTEKDGRVKYKYNLFQVKGRRL